ncbi:MAG TPA: hypothetical protein DDW49_05215 [Deltaproteobacteria bacterium]|nr:MAG: hypothetical protein A2048_04465 [Deltaproteobacteria bacterium GWA2_45_12]HBF12776.1 hypothetical protein [Deltaproteobacteria bacterium]
MTSVSFQTYDISGDDLICAEELHAIHHFQMTRKMLLGLSLKALQAPDPEAARGLVLGLIFWVDQTIENMEAQSKMKPNYTLDVPLLQPTANWDVFPTQVINSIVRGYANLPPLEKVYFKREFEKFKGQLKDGSVNLQTDIDDSSLIIYNQAFPDEIRANEASFSQKDWQDYVNRQEAELLIQGKKFCP